MSMGLLLLGAWALVDNARSISGGSRGYIRSEERRSSQGMFDMISFLPPVMVSAMMVCDLIQTDLKKQEAR